MSKNPSSSGKSQEPQLVRRLGLVTAVCIVVGSVIGSGVFKKPALMATQLGSPKLLLLVWVVAGLMTFFGSISNAEVAGMFPETGGQYHYFRHIYGEFVAYLYGWACFAVIQTGSIASIAFIFAESFSYLVPLPHLSATAEMSWVITIPFIGKIFPLANLGVKVLTCALIILLTIINVLGVVLGGMVQDVITMLKIACLLSLVVLAFFVPHASITHFYEHLPTMATTHLGVFAAFIAAMSGAFWAYDGWNNVTFISGEVTNPKRNIPLALGIGTAIVMGVYVLINFAYVYAFPIADMSHSSMIASDMGQAALGPLGARIVLMMILVSTFGACNGSLLTSARVYFAMAQEKLFFESIGKVNPRFHTPGNSLWLQAFWSSLLVLSGTFDMLTDMLIFVTWIFYALGCAGVFVLRKKMPDTPRPYRVWGYPYVPAIFILFSVIFLVQTLYNDISAYNAGQSPIINSVFGIFLTLLGWPLLWFFNKKKMA